MAIIMSAAAEHNLPLAAGTLISGIAMQTMVLVICDLFVKGKRPLSYLVGSLIPVLEASLVMAMVAIVFMGSIVLRPAKRYVRLGLDSSVAILAFIMGMAGLLLVAH